MKMLTKLIDPVNNTEHTLEISTSEHSVMVSLPGLGNGQTAEPGMALTVTNGTVTVHTWDEANVLAESDVPTSRVLVKESKDLKRKSKKIKKANGQLSEDEVLVS